MWVIASQGCLAKTKKLPLSHSRRLRCGVLPRRGVCFLNKKTFIKAGGYGVGHCLAGVFCSSNKKIEAGGSGVGRCLAGTFFFSQNNPFSFLDITFRVNVANPPCPPTKHSLSEFIRVIRVIGVIAVIRGNATNRPGPDLCSTRSG